MNTCQMCGKTISNLETYGKYGETLCFICLHEKQNEAAIAPLEIELSKAENDYQEIASEWDMLGAKKNVAEDKCKEIEDKIAELKAKREMVAV